jgi:hypothetical protein
MRFLKSDVSPTCTSKNAAYLDLRDSVFLTELSLQEAFRGPYCEDISIGELSIVDAMSAGLPALCNHVCDIVRRCAKE